MTGCFAGGFMLQCDRAHSPTQRAVCLAACALLLVVSTGVLVALVAEHEALQVHRRLLMQYRYDNKTIAFPAHGSLRVLHFTDVQIASLTDKCKNYAGPCDARQSIRFLQRLLAEDRPDLVVLGGDNVDGQHGDAAAREVLTRILEPIQNARIPFVAILGNHDIYRYQMSVSDMHAFFQEQGALFSGNGVLGIQDGQDTICQIFLLDYMYQFTLLWAFYQHIPTHALATVGLPTGISRDRNENSITAEQVAWFEKASTHSAPASLVFTHIPLPQHKTLHAENVTGTRNEEVASFPDNAAGASLWRAMERGDIDVVAVGHDHVNDFCGRHTSGPYLCYAGAAGYTTYGLEGWPRRARYFDVSREGGITTYKRLDDEALSIIDTEHVTRGTQKAADSRRVV